jgi:VWFA-related protein
MRISRISFSSFFLVVVLSAWCLNGQDNKGKASVPIISMDAVVTDAAGKPVPTLKQSDFEIYDDGELQETRYFEAAENPRSVMMLFDVTSVLDKQQPFMIKGMNALYANLRDQDRVAVGAVGPELDVLLSFKKVEKGKSLNVKIPQEKSIANLYESLKRGARLFDKEKGRKIIIAMTDGRETYMFNETKRLGGVKDLKDDDDFKDFLEDARKRGIPYYFVALDADPRLITGDDTEYAYFTRPEGYMRSTEYANAGRANPKIGEEYLAGVRLRMEKLADATGGMVIYMRSLQDVPGFYSRISSDLANMYSLGYSPKPAAINGKPHKIEVRVKDKALKVMQTRTMWDGTDPTK